MGVNYICDLFPCPCHLGSHICSFRADLVCAVFWCVLTLVWLPMHSIFNGGTYVNVCDLHTKAV